MRFALNLLYLLPGVVGGTETYARGLIGALAAEGARHEFLVYLNQESRDWPLPAVANVHRVVCPVRASSRPRRYLFEQTALPLMLRRHRADVVHSLGYVGPLLTPCPSVVTIHDLNYRAFGSLMPGRKRLGLAAFVRLSALRAARVITDSHFVTEELRQAFGLTLGHVTAIPLAPSVCLTQTYETGRACEDGRPYALAFSSSSPNKNLDRLLKAYVLARATHGVAHRLVLVGHRPSGDLSAALQAAVPAESVVATGYLDEVTLSSVLRGACFLVYPSLYEGFGLPILEAMAAGVPVVCSNRASLPEVAGNAAVFFDPYSVEDMAVAIARVAADPELRDDLRQKGLQNVKRFSWERAARETLAVYEEVLGQSR